MNNSLEVPSGVSLLTLAFFFSTGKHGFLYDFTNTPKNTAVYSYASDSFSAEHNTSCLNVVTKNGLEVYSSRLYALAADHYHSLKKTGKEYKFSNLNEGIKYTLWQKKSSFVEEPVILALKYQTFLTVLFTREFLERK